MAVEASAQDYAQAAHLLLPPGKYWQGKDAQDLLLAQSEELARIHVKVNNAEFVISNANIKKGWALVDYRQMLTDAGMNDFEVADNIGLPFIAGKTKAGQRLGVQRNIYNIHIRYQAADEAKFQSVKPLIQSHKLAHTVIIDQQVTD